MPSAGQLQGWSSTRIVAASLPHVAGLAWPPGEHEPQRQLLGQRSEEHFFLNLKMERIWQRDYANHGEATRDITDYIVGFYNDERLHSKLGYLSPNAYERATATKHPIGMPEKI
ncbi:Integrase, catalytic region [Laribacter hongkongensis HLHK9]|uniref:Integrase, catalytic region n=1 Tax=Laribacter hongkongensis (strain HLHK9) TaxID=557598 RepID=C1D5Y5_LARHH|nr:Integrase, catalytic region [Laribacter hongkongensis HLHK9]ACO74162.1 Integrase, catalytic region [Laribacter hongkongensis HLHK9]